MPANHNLGRDEGYIARKIKRIMAKERRRRLIPEIRDSTNLIKILAPCEVATSLIAASLVDINLLDQQLPLGAARALNGGSTDTKYYWSFPHHVTSDCSWSHE
jgi:hypothetical protein